MFNFCTGRGVSIAQRVGMIQSFTQFKGEIVWNTIPDNQLDISKLVGVFSKAHKTLGWKSKYNLERTQIRNRFLERKTLVDAAF